MEKKYNMKSPAVKRLMREAIELKDPTPMYFAQPLEENLFEWHFTILGPSGTDFEGGLYHGRIILPTEYPMKPPSIILLTPNGRFELGQKICLSASSYHPELWQPSWSIRTVLLAMIGFMPTEGVGAIGSLDCPPEERKRLARRSYEWTCSQCGVPNQSILPPMTEGDGNSQEKAMAEAADIVTQMAFKSEAEVKSQKQLLAKKATSSTTSTSSTSPPRQPTAAGEEATDSGSTQSSTSTSGDHGSQPVATTSPDGLRQRSSAASNSPGTYSNTNNFSSMVSAATRQSRIPRGDALTPVPSRGWGSLILMWVLLIAIALLVARRVYATYYGPSSEQGL